MNWPKDFRLRLLEDTARGAVGCCCTDRVWTVELSPDEAQGQKRLPDFFTSRPQKALFDLETIINKCKIACTRVPQIHSEYGKLKAKYMYYNGIANCI